MKRHLLVPAAAAAGLAVTILLGILPAPLRAQTSDRRMALETRVFTIHFKEISDIFLLIEDHIGPDGSIWMQPKLKTISITDRAATLDRIEGLIAGYDLPPRNVEISFRLILATTVGEEGQVRPPRIRDILRKIDEVTTRWGNYRLLGSATVIGTEGERSEIQVGDGYRIGFLIEYAGERQGVVTVRLADFSLEQRQDPDADAVDAAAAAERPETAPYLPLLSTSLNLNRDQLYILGASKNEGHDRALFVTISASTM